MKNLFGLIVLGIFLYVVMGGTMPSFTHYLGDSEISYDQNNVGSDDVFVGLHLVTDDDGTHRVKGVSHWGQLLVDEFWARVFQRDPAVERSYVAQTQPESVPVLPCDASFVDVADDDRGQAVDLLGDLCIVGGMGEAKFYPQNHIRRGSVAKMVAGALMYAYQGDAIVPSALSVYDDVPAHLQSSVAQLGQWGLDEVFARDAEVFGVDDVITREEATSFLQMAIASLPETVSTSDSFPVPVSSDYVTRAFFARMVVDGLGLTRPSATDALALQ